MSWVFRVSKKAKYRRFGHLRHSVVLPNSVVILYPRAARAILLLAITSAVMQTRDQKIIKPNDACGDLDVYSDEVVPGVG